MTNERGILRVQTSKENLKRGKTILANTAEPNSLRHATPRSIEDAMLEQCRDDQTEVEVLAIERLMVIVSSGGGGEGRCLPSTVHNLLFLHNTTSTSTSASSHHLTPVSYTHLTLPTKRIV